MSQFQSLMQCYVHGIIRRSQGVCKIHSGLAKKYLTLLSKPFSWEQNLLNGRNWTYLVNLVLFFSPRLTFTRASFFSFRVWIHSKWINSLGVEMRLDREYSHLRCVLVQYCERVKDQYNNLPVYVCDRCFLVLRPVYNGHFRCDFLLLNDVKALISQMFQVMKSHDNFDE